ncbi:MAG: MBL fold metallo-hydrolase [Pseudomonadales bacterium]
MKISKQPNERVRLNNSGDLSLYFVGAGAAFAKSLNQNNVLVVKGNDHLLIDCGTKCCQALHQIGVSVGDIRHFLITHSHADHIGGLEEVMLFNRYVARQKPSMVINEEYQKILWEQSLRGGTEMSESQGLQFEDFWDIVRPIQLNHYPRETWEATIGSINVKMPRTRHIPDDAKSWQDAFWSCGVILDDRVLFTSDTQFDPDLLESFDAMFHFEYIFHDCQLFTAGVHASIHELAALSEKLKAKTILMHYGDNWRDYRQLAEKAGFHSFAKEGHTYRF